MTEPAFVIVGSGRHGSAYIAQVLTAAGVRCGHEQWWNPFGEHDDDTLVGDSSWCALPLGLDDYHGLVFHQVRHPLDTVASFARAPINPTRDWPWYSLHRHLIFEPSDDPLVYGMQAWLSYTVAAQQVSSWTWRLDQVTAELVCEIGEKTGRTVDRLRAEQAMSEVPRDVNRHHDGPGLSWPELGQASPDLTELVWSWAAVLGFADA